LHGELGLLQKILEKPLGHHHRFGPFLNLHPELAHQLVLGLDQPLVVHHHLLVLDLSLACLGEGLEFVFGLHQ
jgi:hypothetical protein